MYSKIFKLIKEVDLKIGVFLLSRRHYWTLSYSLTRIDIAIEVSIKA
jgi:hypothetical protein